MPLQGRPFSRAKSSAAKTRSAAPSPRLRPSRFWSKGLQGRDESMRRAEKPEKTNRLTRSRQTTMTDRTAPRLIMEAARARATEEEAQALLILTPGST